jgi:hypothetical protein
VAATEPRGLRFLFLLPLVAAVASALSVRADERFSGGMTIYANDDGLLVLHPAAGASGEVAEGWRVNANYEADIISAATVDIRTSASPRGYEETRHGVGMSLERALSSTARWTTGYVVSRSPDYLANTAMAGMEVEDAERRHTFAVNAAMAMDKVGRVGDVDWTGTLWTAGATLSWSMVLSPRSVLDLAVSGELRRGYQESPYRFVPILEPDASISQVAVPESVPDVRRRFAARTELRYALAKNVFTRVSWRVHTDDWGIVGQTLKAAGSIELSDRWLLGVDGRFYAQRGASFYQGVYRTLPDLPQWRTRDRQLAPGWYVAGGCRARWTFARWWEGSWYLHVRTEVIHTRYIDTPLLPRRLGYVGGLSVVVER